MNSVEMEVIYAWHMFAASVMIIWWQVSYMTLGRMNGPVTCIQAYVRTTIVRNVAKVYLNFELKKYILENESVKLIVNCKLENMP